MRNDGKPAKPRHSGRGLCTNRCTSATEVSVYYLGMRLICWRNFMNPFVFTFASLSLVLSSMQVIDRFVISRTSQYQASEDLTELGVFAKSTIPLGPIKNLSGIQQQ